MHLGPSRTRRFCCHGLKQNLGAKSLLGHVKSAAHGNTSKSMIERTAQVSWQDGNETDCTRLIADAPIATVTDWALTRPIDFGVHLFFRGCPRLWRQESGGRWRWGELFSEPAKWRGKASPWFPDFKHKKQAHKALWLDSKWTPLRVEEIPAAKGPWALESAFSSQCELAYAGKKADIENLWRELFSDPSEWRDHRCDKANASFPDFRHKKHIEKALWLDSKLIPPWVKENLAALPPGSIQLSTFSRNQRLSRYVQAGQYDKTIELFQQMQRDGNVDKFTFFPVLKACGNLGLLELGRRVHSLMPQGFKKDIFMGNTLVDMYAKCGSTEEAERVFRLMPTRDVVTLNAMIGGYVNCGEGQKALELFERMQGQSVDPDRVTFVGVLNACASIRDLEVGRRAHQEIVRRGYDSDVVVGTCLVDMYAKCGRIEQAERVFQRMPARDVVTLTAMIAGYVKCGEGLKALELFEQVQGQGMDPDCVTFIGVLNACASVAALEVGRRTHDEIIRRGYETDLGVGTCLVDMYAKCGSIEEAERVFNKMPTRCVVMLNAMIGGYVRCGVGQKALELFEQMQAQGLIPDRVTFVGVLNACGSVEALEVGRRVHEQLIRSGYDSDLVVGNCLVDMYAKCGSIEEAERIFKQMTRRDIVTLTAMISGYVKCGAGQKALELFEQMQRQEVDPDPAAFVGVLNACANVAALKVGRRAHEDIIHRGYESDVIIGNCLINMYAKCGSIEEAERVFKGMSRRDVVTLNAMIGGYVKCGEGERALDLFEQMQGQAVDPDPVTFVGVLNACASIATLEVGSRVHEEIIRRGYGSDVVLGNCLIDMYSKCGSIEKAERVFKEMPARNVITWTALLAGYSIHGHARRALETFKEMCKVVEVDSVTFLALLSACSHGGLGAEGLEYFKSMGSIYNITPTMEHFACLVDILGRAGHLGEAEDLIMSMPMDPDTTVWMTLLGSCRAHVNVEVGERCLERVLELDPDNVAAYILLSNIYVTAGKFNSCGRIHGERLFGIVKKVPRNTTNSFTVHMTTSNCENLADLERMSCKFKDAGYLL